MATVATNLYLVLEASILEVCLSKRGGGRKFIEPLDILTFYLVLAHRFIHTLYGRIRCD
jgi:hypothetical protein